MKIIITESQQESLKNKLQQINDKLGMGKAIKSVGGFENFVKILYDGDYDPFVNNVLENLMSNTHSIGEGNWPDYYLFGDCDISSFLKNERKHNPSFICHVPCFCRVLDEQYGLDHPEIDFCDFFWERYSKLFIDQYRSNHWPPIPKM